MPWLVVQGGGSWSPSAPEYRRRIYRDGAHHVEPEIAAEAALAGFDWLVVMEDEDVPELETPDDSGPLTPEDLKESTAPGSRVKLAVIEGGASGEPLPQEEPEFEHKCRWCRSIPKRSFPSRGALARHIEFEHPRVHALGEEDAEDALAEAQEKKDQMRRLLDAEPPIRPEDREAIELHLTGREEPPTVDS